MEYSKVESPISQPSKMVTVNVEQEQLAQRKSKLKTISEVNESGVLNNDAFTEKCHHGTPIGLDCETCDLDKASPPKNPSEVKETKKLVDDVFGDEQQETTVVTATNGTVVEYSEVPRTIDKTQILSNLLQQQHELNKQADVQYKFQDALIKKYETIANAKDNNYRNNGGSSHTMNGLIENIQRGFTEGLAFRKEQARINMDLLKVLDSLKEIKKEEDIQAIVSEVMKSMNKK